MSVQRGWHSFPSVQMVTITMQNTLGLVATKFSKTKAIGGLDNH